jgi:diguanylate cyclase
MATTLSSDNQFPGTQIRLPEHGGTVFEEDDPKRIQRAQRLRLQRMSWGLTFQSVTLTIAVVLWLSGLVAGARLLEYLLAVLLLELAIIAAIRTNFNLRFRDPSLTSVQIVAPVWPAVYFMFFIVDPQARTVFLLMATGGLLFGALGVDRRGMLKMGAVIVLAYVMLLVALWHLAPERLNWRVEVAIVMAYSAVLSVVSYLGSFVMGLRQSVKEANIEMRQAMVALEDLATRDPLTSLPNRRSIMEQLDRESSRVERRDPTETALCLSILDIDHFKQVNDVHGHQVGDAVLRQVGKVLQDTVRKGDFVGRYGGEEFLILLPECSGPKAMAATERVRKAVENAIFEALPVGEHITVSQGVAVHRHGENIHDTLKRADQVLYEAKAKGRNQVVIDSDDLPKAPVSRFAPD